MPSATARLHLARLDVDRSGFLEGAEFERGGGARMGSEPVTPESVLASVDADPRLRSQRDRCFVYHELARWSRGFTEAEYASAGRQGCAPHPFEQFPW